MANVKLILKNKEGKKEIFKNIDTTGKDYRTALETIKKLSAEGTKSWDQLDYYLTFTKQIFRNDKLTDDQILDGLPSEKVISTLDDVLGQVLGAESDPDPEAKK